VSTAILLASCQTPTTGTSGAKDACLAWPVISYSGSADSAPTKLEIRKANAARKEYCG
jgi:hypothetical protein